MALLPQLEEFSYSLSSGEDMQVTPYINILRDAQTANNLRGLVSDSPNTSEFISSSTAVPLAPGTATIKQPNDDKGNFPAYASPSFPLPAENTSPSFHRPHTNAVIEAGNIRAEDEQYMQNLLQNLQFQYGIYNSEIEPEHDANSSYCTCPIHTYKMLKARRYGILKAWSKAVMYPGEKSYDDSYQNSPGESQQTILYVTRNPYSGVISAYGRRQNSWSSLPQMPRPDSHTSSIHKTIRLNKLLNQEAQDSVDAYEPKVNIWDDGGLNAAMLNMTITTTNDQKGLAKKTSDKKRLSSAIPLMGDNAETPAKLSKLASFKKSIGIKSSNEKAAAKGHELRNSILAEEQGRWPDQQWRQIVASYQEKVGMTRKIADLRARYPLQYLHLLRAGYFEPIPVAWANQASNPLKFTIDAAAGWRGITPTWRGYEDTAEERLYWVLNHREGSVRMRMKPDLFSTMDMARARIASAVEPPPQYYAANDTCYFQHTSLGYSKQVMPTPFKAYDRPQVPTDDTVILLDVSGSMDFDPIRPNYDRYLITSYSPSIQPKNKDVAKAIIRRFTDAMANHDHDFGGGYSLVTFSSQAHYIGTINHRNIDALWRNIRIGGGTRVMTGWQKVKNLHFQKHSASAIYHPVYGWQAGPETPMLRLLLLLDGEATDMDEFELDLLGLSWAHVTIFLIGVDGCPHHHRHANELQRISDVNHHVSFVDAQGNTPERFVTHELLKRHLGYEISMSEFEQMEELPAYSVST